MQLACADAQDRASWPSLPTEMLPQEPSLSRRGKTCLLSQVGMQTLPILFRLLCVSCLLPRPAFGEAPRRCLCSTLTSADLSLIDALRTPPILPTSLALLVSPSSSFFLHCSLGFPSSGLALTWPWHVCDTRLSFHPALFVHALDANPCVSLDIHLHLFSPVHLAWFFVVVFCSPPR